MTSAELRLLPDENDVLIGYRLRHLFAAVPIDDTDAVGTEPTRRIDDMGEQRSARQQMQHLGPLRKHALALTGGKNNDVQRHAGIIA
jgi:hypothetical protein